MQSFRVFSQSPNFLWSCSGVLTGTALLFPYTWFLVFVGLGLQLHLLYRASAARSVLWGASMAGMAHMLVVQLWGWEAASLEPLGVSPLAQFVIIFFGWIFSSLLIGIGYGICLWLVRYIVEDHWVTFVIFPFAVLGGELVGRLLFSLGNIGLDTALNVAYGFGHLGYALVAHGILRFAAIFGGVYALTLLVGALSVLFYVLFVVYRRYWFGVAFVTLFLATSVVVLGFRADAPLPEDVALVSTHLTMEFEKSLAEPQLVNEVYEEAIREALTRDTTAIILPEDSRFFSTLNEEQRDVYAAQLASSSVTFVESARNARNDKTVLSAVIFDDATAKTYTYDKQHLVPFGEQIPVIPAFFLRIIGMKEIVDTLRSDFGYRTGVHKSETAVPEHLPVVLFCYESVVPYAVRMLRDAETPYIAHVVSHAWFDDQWGILGNQLSAMLRIQAMWANVPILQAANITPAAVYTPGGAVYRATALPGAQYGRVDMVGEIIAESIGR